MAMARVTSAAPPASDPSDLPVTRLKGIGAKRAALLAHRGVRTLADFLRFLPRRYEDRRLLLTVAEAGPGVRAWVRGRVVSGREAWFPRSGKRLFRVLLRDPTGEVELVWFNYRKPLLQPFTRQGLEMLAFGELQRTAGRLQMIHPELIPAERAGADALGILPVYPALPGLSVRTLRAALREALARTEDGLSDPVPPAVLQELGLPGVHAALSRIHFPPPEAVLEELNASETPEHRRLLFERFFLFMLIITLRKRHRKSRGGPLLFLPDDLHRRLDSFFPFRLTGGQRAAVDELLADLGGGSAMNRLLQGDVGCGKTVVAAAAAWVTAQNGYQTALMVPTQVLAHQHFEYFSGLPPAMGLRPVLLTGGLGRLERTAALARLRSGEANLAIGTHALIQAGVDFARLGLAVIDEQHRFGVRQRALLDAKAPPCHLLVMTATPIPRSLAMSVYADLDVSVIRELPPGRRVTETRLVDRGRKRWVYETLRAALAAGRQGMVICPVIEGSEDSDLKNALGMHAALSKLFSPPFRVGLLHGRLAADEKDRVAEDFRKGTVDLLVGTTVVEVGVHAPGAGVIVIEHPERFGLAQLHQLRGRVGRGEEPGLCLLMLPEELAPEARRRLEILAATHDGFEIARKDLELRGHGELTGTRQAGTGELDLGDISRQPELLAQARRAAEQLAAADPELRRPEHRRLRDLLQAQLSTPSDP